MQAIIDVFRRVFVSFGYYEQVASPIFPSPDPTTLFTCATMSALKGYMYDKSFVMQPCLRVQNLKQALDEEYDPEYLSKFVMLGCLCPVEKFSTKSILDFFNSFPGVSEKMLVKNSYAIDNDLFRQLRNHYRIEYDTHEPGYYKWNFGEKELSGNGITFAIKQPTELFLDIGNIVLVHKNNIPIAVEFGFGFETFLSRMTGQGTPYAVSQEYQKLGLGLSATEKCLGDCLIVASSLFEGGVKPGSGKASSVMRKALRNACFLCEKHYGGRANERMDYFSHRISPNPIWHDIVEDTFKRVHGSLKAFNHEVDHIRNHASGNYLAMKVKEYRLRYNIPEQF